MKALFLIVLLALSCMKKSSPLSKDAVGMRLKDVEMNISHLSEVEWHVGKWKDTILTQSFIFHVEMPKVSEEDLEFLQKEKHVDAWIIRLIVQRRSEKQDLGSLYAQFMGKKFTRGHAGGAPSNVALRVYYAAAYASERFRSFKCPAFNHRFRITDMKVAGEASPFDITFDQTTSYPEKSQLIELHPSSFNAGNNLVGEYYVEIAPYNSHDKTIHGSFKRLPVWIEVSREEQVSVPTCEGVHEEIR